MDKKEMVDNIRNVLTYFIKEKCNVNMAMLIKDINSNTYTFLVSSDFFNLLTPYEATKFIAEYFFNKLDKDVFRFISRINVVHTNDPSISVIYRAINIKGGIAEIENCNFFGVQIDNAILFESHKD